MASSASESPNYDVFFCGASFGLPRAFHTSPSFRKNEEAMSLLTNWKSHDFAALENGVIVARHTLAESGFFSDEGLAEILDNHPDSALTLSTMGEDSHTFEWRDGDRNGVCGADLIDTVNRGHLWINCREILLHQPQLANLVNEVYDELEKGNARFRAQDRSANLLISSPSAVVHYHVDMPVNMLWHLRGRKRVWVYPHFDPRFASLPVLEKVCAGEWSEDVPYDADWDKYALVFDAEPGQLITWPQLTPHRVTNLDGLNVSLSTEHKNARARRRLNVHQANHFLRHTLGRKPASAEVEGFQAHAKQTLARAVRYASKIIRKEKEQFVYPKSFVVDPDAPRGYRVLEGHEATTVAPHLEDELTAV